MPYFVVLLLHRPQTPTLFPYTTLFRSKSSYFAPFAFAVITCAGAAGAGAAGNGGAAGVDAGCCQGCPPTGGTKPALGLAAGPAPVSTGCALLAVSYAVISLVAA